MLYGKHSEKCLEFREHYANVKWIKEKKSVLYVL